MVQQITKSHVEQAALEQLSGQAAPSPALQDRLLPKLISGVLRITDTERIVGRMT